MDVDRRYFLKFGAQAAMVCLCPTPAIAITDRFLSPKRKLSFYNTHTEESLEVCYYIQGRYQLKALKNINYALRDHRTDEIKSIDINLLNSLYSIKKKLNISEPFHIVSGYRSPGTNEYLYQRRKGVAKNSLHMHGKAIDFRLPDISLPVLRRTAAALKAGGVGYYPCSNFIHIDVGPIRYWRYPG
ncbi:MAG: YcbK family protein [Desulfobacterales bacterium]|jgi:uncharacterized protein YcbK (DUF882 family)